MHYSNYSNYIILYSNCYRDVFCCVPVMVVTHSRRSVLMSVRSLAPARDGAGRGLNLYKDSGMSCFEKDVEGPFSDWEGKKDI